MAGVGLVAVVAVAVGPACAGVVVTADEMVASTRRCDGVLPRRRRCGRTESACVSRDPAALEIFDADAARLPGDYHSPVVLPGTLRQHESVQGHSGERGDEAKNRGHL